VILLSEKLSDSIAFVVYTAFRIVTGVSEAQNHSRPIAPPGLTDRRVLRIPLRCECLETLLGCGFGERFVNRFQVTDHCLSFFPRHEIQAVPHQMHDAELHLCSRKHRFNRLWKTFESIHAGVVHCTHGRDEHVLHASVLQLCQDPQPELRAFVARFSRFRARP
jgi:hypothetical protein